MRRIITFILCCLPIIVKAQMSFYEAEIDKAAMLYDNYNDAKSCYEILDRIPEKAVSEMQDTTAHLYYFYKGMSNPWWDNKDVSLINIVINDLKKDAEICERNVYMIYWGYITTLGCLGDIYKELAYNIEINDETTYYKYTCLIDTARTYFIDAYVLIQSLACLNIAQDELSINMAKNTQCAIYENCLQLYLYKITDYMESCNCLDCEIIQLRKEYSDRLDSIQTAFDVKYVRNSEVWCDSMSVRYDAKVASVDTLFELDTELSKSITLYKSLGNDDKYIKLKNSCIDFIVIAAATCRRWDILLEYVDLEIEISVSKKDDEAVASCYFYKGIAYDSKGDYRKSMGCMNKIERFLKSSKTSQFYRSWAFAVNYRNQGLDYFSKGQYRKAIECYNKSLKFQPNPMTEQYIFEAELMLNN